MNNNLKYVKIGQDENGPIYDWIEIKPQAATCIGNCTYQYISGNWTLTTPCAAGQPGDTVGCGCVPPDSTTDTYTAYTAPCAALDCYLYNCQRQCQGGVYVSTLECPGVSECSCGGPAIGAPCASEGQTFTYACYSTATPNDGNASGSFTTGQATCSNSWEICVQAATGTASGTSSASGDSNDIDVTTSSGSASANASTSINPTLEITVLAAAGATSITTIIATNWQVDVEEASGTTAVTAISLTIPQISIATGLATASASAVTSGESVVIATNAAAISAVTAGATGIDGFPTIVTQTMLPIAAAGAAVSAAIVNVSITSQDGTSTASASASAVSNNIAINSLGGNASYGVTINASLVNVAINALGGNVNLTSFASWLGEIGASATEGSASAGASTTANSNQITTSTSAGAATGGSTATPVLTELSALSQAGTSTGTANASGSAANISLTSASPAVTAGASTSSGFPLLLLNPYVFVAATSTEATGDLVETSITTQSGTASGGVLATGSSNIISNTSQTGSATGTASVTSGLVTASFTAAAASIVASGSANGSLVEIAATVMSNTASASSTTSGTFINTSILAPSALSAASASATVTMQQLSLLTLDGLTSVISNATGALVDVGLTVVPSGSATGTALSLVNLLSINALPAAAVTSAGAATSTTTNEMEMFSLSGIGQAHVNVQVSFPSISVTVPTSTISSSNFLNAELPSVFVGFGNLAVLIDVAKSWLLDLFDKRGTTEEEFETIRTVELRKGEVLEPTAFEPDPRTHRQDYYYNAKTNVLYKKIITKRSGSLIMNAHWKRVSN